MSAAWGCAGALRGAVHERSMGLRRGAARGCAWRCMELCTSAARGCAGALHGVALGRCMGLRMSAAWGCAGA